MKHIERVREIQQEIYMLVLKYELHDCFDEFNMGISSIQSFEVLTHIRNLILHLFNPAGKKKSIST